MAIQPATVGDLLRDWRARRRLSQLDLACEAEVSTRHLSFVESGRAAASRDVLVRLSNALALPLRQRNRLLLAGGYAPLYGERAIDEPDMVAAKTAVEAVLLGHQPYPALAVDRHWNLVMANPAAIALLGGIDATLLGPPMNVLRASLHPLGLAPRIVNLDEWRHHLLTRLRQDADRSADRMLLELYEELKRLPWAAGRIRPLGFTQVAVPLIIQDPESGAILSFVSTTTVFGTAVDVTLAELTLECFYPLDDATRRALSSRSHQTLLKPM